MTIHLTYVKKMIEANILKYYMVVVANCAGHNATAHIPHLTSVILRSCELSTAEPKKTPWNEERSMKRVPATKKINLIVYYQCI